MPGSQPIADGSNRLIQQTAYEPVILGLLIEEPWMDRMMRRIKMLTDVDKILPTAP